MENPDRHRELLQIQKGLKAKWMQVNSRRRDAGYSVKGEADSTHI